MSAVDTVKVAKDGATTPAPFNIAFQDKDGTGASLAPIHALRNSSGVDIDPATSELQSSVQSAPGTPQTAAVSIQGNAAAIPVPVSDGGSPITGASIPAGGVGLTGWLSAIWSKLSGTLSVSWSGQSVAVSNFPSSQTVAGSVLVSNLPATQAISADALPLPSGAAQETGGNLASIATNVSTAANQTTANTTLASILTKLGAVVLSTGSAIIGKVGIDQTTPGTTNGVVINSSALPTGAATAANQTSPQSAPGTPQTVALTIQGNASGIAVPAALAGGSNVIGYAGSLNTQVVATPTITTSYASGACVGGLQTLSNFFRNAAQPSATLSQFFIGWTGAETVNLTAFIFSKAPGISPTDGVAPSFTAADLRNLVTIPITTILAAPAAGSTKNFSATSLSLSVKNLESTLNLYVVLVADAAIATSANGDLFFSISGVLD